MAKVDGMAHCVESDLKREFRCDPDDTLQSSLVPFWCARWTASLSWWQRVKFWVGLILSVSRERERMP